MGDRPAMGDHLYVDRPANTGNSPNTISMSAHRLHWPNIETALGECLVFAERPAIGYHLYADRPAMEDHPQWRPTRNGRPLLWETNL